MNKPNQPKRREARSRFYITDKAIMGGYFNLARMNFFKTMMTIFAKIGVDVRPIDEEQMPIYLTAFSKEMDGKRDEIHGDDFQAWARKLKLNKENMLLLQQLLMKHLPFLGPIMAGDINRTFSKKRKAVDYSPGNDHSMRGAMIQDYWRIIMTMASCLSDCRNYYTHYNPYNSLNDQKKQYRRQLVVASWLEKVRDASRVIHKQRNGLTTVEMEFLTSVDRYFTRNKKDDYGNTIFDRGKPLKDYVEYDDYYFSIMAKRSRIDAAGRAIEGEEKWDVLSDFGVVFFCTLFLEKEQARLMQEELRLYQTGPYDGSEDGDFEKNEILREMFSVYRIRVPHGKRLDPMDNATLLAMDMLNELRKCPMPLYDVLPRAAKQEFEDVVRHPNEMTQEVFKRLRSTDRFPYLALRYIDLIECFGNIRFQVQLGKFRYKFYDKTTIDGDQVVRGLEKEINGFGRLQDVELARQEKYGHLLQQTVEVETGEENITIDNLVADTATSAPYLSDRKASYNIHSNRIGLFWNEKDEKQLLIGDDKLYLPVLAVDDNGKANVEMPAPRASLSVRDLPALIFYLDLRQQLRQQYPQLPHPEQVIRDKYHALVNFFTDVAEGRLQPCVDRDVLEARLMLDYDGLTLNDIPTKLRDYLSGIEGNEEDEDCAARLKGYALSILEKRYKQVEGRINRLKEARKIVGDKQNKYGKKSYVDVSPRKLAEHLAQSIVDWQPSIDNGRNKLTGKNYQRMIAFMASYTDETPVQELKDMFTRAGLLEGPSAHPFLKRILDLGPSNIEVFYDNYCKEEKRRLYQCLKIETRNDEEVYELKPDADLSLFPFLHAGRVRFHKRDEAAYRSLSMRYLQVDGRPSTIQLPDGLFTGSILKAMGVIDVMQPYLQDKELNGNASYLMSAYLEHVMHDKSQPFYFYERQYDLFAELQNKKAVDKVLLLPCPLTVQEINRRLTCKTDDGKNKQIKREIQQLMEQMERATESKIAKYRLSGKYAQKKREAGIEERQKKARKLSHLIADVKKNERTIRRYKTQDLAIFLMAKRLIGDALSWAVEDADMAFKLANVCEERFLSQTMKFSYTYHLDKMGAKTVDIVQENMSLKNYGSFFRFLYDDRVRPLLQRLVDQQQVSFSALTSELANYNQCRSTAFDRFQQFEKMAFELNKVALTDQNHPLFVARKNGRIIGETRNKFAVMLGLLDAVGVELLDAEDRSWLKNVRNAFCHNSYGGIDMRDVEMKLPRIIEQIVRHVDDVLQETKDKQRK